MRSELLMHFMVSLTLVLISDTVLVGAMMNMDEIKEIEIKLNSINLNHGINFEDYEDYLDFDEGPYGYSHGYPHAFPHFGQMNHNHEYSKIFESQLQHTKTFSYITNMEEKKKEITDDFEFVLWGKENIVIPGLVEGHHEQENVHSKKIAGRLLESDFIPRILSLGVNVEEFESATSQYKNESVFTGVIEYEKKFADALYVPAEKVYLNYVGIGKKSSTK